MLARVTGTSKPQQGWGQKGMIQGHRAVSFLVEAFEQPPAASPPQAGAVQGGCGGRAKELGTDAGLSGRHLPGQRQRHPALPTLCGQHRAQPQVRGGER